MLDHLEDIKSRFAQRAAKVPNKISICTASGCPGAGQVKSAIEKEVKARGLNTEYGVKEVGCRGLCACGPLVGVGPTDRSDLASEIHYQKVSVEAVPALARPAHRKRGGKQGGAHPPLFRYAVLSTAA